MIRKYELEDNTLTGNCFLSSVFLFWIYELNDHVIIHYDYVYWKITMDFYPQTSLYIFYLDHIQKNEILHGLDSVYETWHNTNEEVHSTQICKKSQKFNNRVTPIPHRIK